MVDSGGVEPSAEMRTAAHQMRELYIALVMEGFTEAQAMQIIGVTLAAGIAGNK